jgi:hypothetical protein
MEFTKKINDWFLKKKDRQFWKTPDKWLVAVILDDTKNQVYGKVKNGLAILESIPKPETGYSYLDVVKVAGPIGKQKFRDDEIEEYKVIEIFKKSNIPTFTFKARIPNPGDYFKLCAWFEKNGKKVVFPWSSKENNLEWRKGFCTADNLEQAIKILTEFIKSDSSREVKDILNWDYYKIYNG